MYSDRIAELNPHPHTIALLVNDEPGVFSRVSNLFMKRNFNINTITVGSSVRQGISKITITFFGDDRVYEQLVKQLSKLIDVVKTIDLPEQESVIRDLALLKVRTKKVEDQNQLMNYCKAYRARIVDVSSKEMIVEIAGKPKKVDTFIDLVKPFGISDISRTGITAILRSQNGNGRN